MNIHLVADRFDDEKLAELLQQCAIHYGHVLGAPMERIRVFISEHRASTVFVDGVVASAQDAPYFEYAVLAGRPQSEIDELMTGFTDIVEEVLGVVRTRIRGVCRPASPDHWGIGGAMASTIRATEVAARAVATEGATNGGSAATHAAVNQ